MYLTNINYILNLPEIDNITELNNEEKNNEDFESLRNLVTNSFLQKNKKNIISTLKKILISNFTNSEKILNKNEKWVNNILFFLKDFNLKQNKIHKRNYCQSLDLVKNGFATKNIELKEIILRSNLLLETAKKTNLNNSNKYVWDQSVQADSTLINLINKEFEREGILKDSSAYLGKKVKVRKSTIILSTPEDSQYKLFLGDIEYYNDKYINYHIDPKGGLLKAMVYLNEVDINSGPFQVVKKSHNFSFDPIKLLFARAICTSNYCDSPEKRILINSLPKGLRSSLNFGRMLNKNSSLTRLIDKDLVTITSDKANTVLFIPDKVIHRGAICKSNARLALQVQIF